MIALGPRAYEFPLLAAIFNSNEGLPLLVKNLEREALDIGLYLGVIELSSEKPLRSEDTEETIKIQRDLE